MRTTGNGFPSFPEQKFYSGVNPCGLQMCKSGGTVMLRRFLRTTRQFDSCLCCDGAFRLLSGQAPPRHHTSRASDVRFHRAIHRHEALHHVEPRHAQNHGMRHHVVWCDVMGRAMPRYGRLRHD